MSKHQDSLFSALSVARRLFSYAIKPILVNMHERKAPQSLVSKASSQLKSGPYYRAASSIKLSVALFMALNYTNAHGAMPVFDGAVLAQTIQEQVLAVEQWARDNINQARQINELLSGNTIASDTQMLMDKNYTMDNKYTWEYIHKLQQDTMAMLYASKAIWDEFGSANSDTQMLMDKNYTMDNKYTWEYIHKLQQDTMAMLYASKAIWDEFGSANRYYTSFRKAQAWDQCMQSGNCTFSQTLQNLEDSSISQAMQAYKNAEQMNDKLLVQIDKLQRIADETQNTNSQAATLDGLSKINGSVASSMIDLNAQVAQLTKLQGHALAKQSNQALADEFYFREVAKSTSKKVETLPTRLP